MYKETRTYTDFNGTVRTEDHYFNLTKAEFFELELGAVGGMEGGMTAWIDKLTSEQDGVKIAEVFKTILLASYGVKSVDGRHFWKVDPKDGHKFADDFAQTQAYSDMYMEFVLDAKKSAEFINGIMPTFTEEELKKWEAQAAEIRAKKMAELSAANDAPALAPVEVPAN